MATTQAWHNYTLSLAPFGVESSEQLYQSPSWYELYAYLSPMGAENGANLMITSRLLSRDTVANKYAEVTEALINCGGGLKYVLYTSSYFGPTGCLNRSV